LEYSVIKIELGDIGAHLVLLSGRTMSVLFDAGPKDTVGEGLDEFTGGNLKRIDYLVLTHGHSDHVGGTDMIRGRFGPAVLVHPETADFLEDPEHELGSYWEDASQYMRGEGWRTFEQGIWTVRGRSSMLTDSIVRPPKKIRFDDVSIHIEDAPGHVQGHIAALEPSSGLLIVGDAVQGRGVTTATKPPFPLYNDVAGYRRTIKRFMATRFTRMVSSHPFDPSRQPVMERDAALSQLDESLAVCERLEDEVMSCLGEEKLTTRNGLFREIASRYSMNWPDPVVATTLESHLRDLLRRRKIHQAGRTLGVGR
jgi:glyoxylase-like metal-dependent hydrolase (beta-lactamase superfamily II)